MLVGYKGTYPFSTGFNRRGTGLGVDIRLGQLSRAKVNAAVKSGKPLTVHLNLTDKNGGPLCATPPSTHIRWD